jgi:hypothetical protein
MQKYLKCILSVVICAICVAIGIEVIRGEFGMPADMFASVLISFGAIVHWDTIREFDDC